jgi:hypothetical protein
VAGLAASALDVEAEAAGPVAAQPGFGQPGEQIADGSKYAGVGGGIERGAPDRRWSISITLSMYLAPSARGIFLAVPWSERVLAQRA